MISQSFMYVKHVVNHSIMYWDYKSTAKLTGMALEQTKQFIECILLQLAQNIFIFLFF